MKLADLNHRVRPERDDVDRDDTAEWINCAWVADANGEDRCLFWFDHEAEDFDAFESSFRLRIAPIGKPSFHERRNKRLVPLAVRFGGKVADVPEAARENAAIWAIANEILLDWEGVVDEDEDDEPVEYTVELGVKALVDFRLRDAIVLAASTLEQQRNQSVDDDAEILGNASNGASSTARGSSTKPAKTRSKAKRG